MQGPINTNSNYNPVIQESEAVAAKFSVKVWQSPKLQMFLAYIREGDVRLLNRIDLNRGYNLRLYFYSEIQGEQNPYYWSIGQTPAITAQVGINRDTYYEVVSPVFGVDDKQMLSYKYQGQYYGQRVFFMFRDYTDKSNPFRFDTPLQPDGTTQQGMEEVGNVDAD